MKKQENKNRKKGAGTADEVHEGNQDQSGQPREYTTLPSKAKTSKQTENRSSKMDDTKNFAAQNTTEQSERTLGTGNENKGSNYAAIQISITRAKIDKESLDEETNRKDYTG